MTQRGVQIPPDLLEALVGFGDLKTWSVAFTCLVDLCLQPGTALYGPALARVTERLGIRAEAQRTALHRLRKEGWIDIARSGRESRLSLSPQGRREALAVNERVYAARLSAPGAWHIVVLPPDALPPEGAVQLVRSVFMSESKGDSEALTARLQDGPLPDWAQNALIPPQIALRYADLGKLLAAAPPSGLDAADRQALRTIVLHLWRRLHLSQPLIASRYFESAGVGSICRARVAAWLSALPRADRTEL